MNTLRHGLLVNFSQYEQFQYAKSHNQMFINSIHNPGNSGKLNRIFCYLLDWSLQVISWQLQVFCHFSSHFNLFWITKLIMLELNQKFNWKQETLCVVTIAMICSTLVSLWKRSLYNPVEHLWWSFYCENSKPLSILTNSSIADTRLGSKYAC